jgi:hypothetical protein
VKGATIIACKESGITDAGYNVAKPCITELHRGKD